ncbi:beta-agarase [Pontiella sulfatireligans]|uniref:Beta-porphyranase A n=1 Tax=Pontiella sulfatireligans TaxID=2750658 RepID=A0A6C2UT93_9BACT|nr:beta-agarase [Pontiella sulfatireligans]VGO23488.1 Beta-porphyranase A [Pontiella sulfatireligans]
MKYYLFAVACVASVAGCVGNEAASKNIDWAAPHIVVEPQTTRAIGGVSEVDRKRYFCVSDNGTGFDQRMKPEVYDYLVNELGISFGRSLGPVQYVATTLKEDPSRPGYADLTPLKNKKHGKPGERFEKDFGPNLDVAAHGNHNAYPVYMGKHMHEGVEYHGTPEWIPANIDAAAELAAGVMKYNYTDFDRPKYYEPLNEPHWKYFVDQHMADWHLAVQEKVHALTPDVMVGGMCQSVSYFFRDNYQNFNGFKGFISNTQGKMDFYSFHSYDYLRWRDGEFKGRIQSGLALEGSLDLMQNYTVNTLGKEVDVVVSEQGGYVHSEPKGMYDGEAIAAEIMAAQHPDADPQTWEYEMQKRSIVCFGHVSSILANTMAFIDHPHTVLKSVPFLLPNTWSWDTKYYANLYVPKNYTDQSQWVETHMLDFYKFFRGVNGRRVKVLSSDPDLQTRAFVDGSKMYLAVNNQSWRPESVSLYGIDAKQVEVRRFGRNADFTAYYTEETVPVPEALELAGREAVMIVADFGGTIQEKGKVNEIACYGDKVIVPMKKAEFKIKVPVEKQIDYAVLRVGLTRKTESSKAAVITLNGKPLDVPLEDCADRLADGEYGTTKMVYLNIADLQAENTVSVSFPDGDDGVVGTAVIRAAVVE